GRLLDLLVEWGGLRALPAEEREEAAARAPEPPRLRIQAVEFALLLAGGVLVAPDLVGTGRVDRAAIDRAELRLEPHAHRIGGCGPRRPPGGRRPGAPEGAPQRAPMGPPPPPPSA